MSPQGQIELSTMFNSSTHALRHVHRERSEAKEVKHEGFPASPPAPLVVAPELLDVLRALLAQTTVSEEAPRPYALLSPQREQEANKGEQRANIAQKATGECDDEQMANNYERVKAYLAVYPNAKVRDVAEALTISVSTANKWMNRIRGECLPGQ